MLRCLPLVVPALLACACDPNTASDAPDAGTDTPDAAPADARSELRGTTRIAFIQNGIPYVTDGEASQVAPVWAGEPLGSFYALDLSADGTSLAFCASNDGAAVYPFAGPIGGLRKLADGPMCKDAAIGSDGQVTAWIRYGNGVSAKQLRLHQRDGEPATGDNQLTYPQMWSAQFLDGDREIVALLTGSGLFGSIHRFDRETGESSLLFDGDGDVGADFHVGPGNQIAATHNGDLVIIDANTGETRTVLDLDDHPAIADAGIRLVELPTWSPDGERVAFLGRTRAGGLHTEILIYDIAAATVTRITNDERSDLYPRFDATGAWVYWTRDSNDLVRAPADGTGSIEVLVAGGVAGQFDVTWLPQQ